MSLYWDTRVEGNTDDRKALYMILCAYSPFGAIVWEGLLLGVDRPANTVDLDRPREPSVSSSSRNFREPRDRKEDG